MGEEANGKERNYLITTIAMKSLRCCSINSEAVCWLMTGSKPVEHMLCNIPLFSKIVVK